MKNPIKKQNYNWKEYLKNNINKLFFKTFPI